MDPLPGHSPRPPDHGADALAEAASDLPAPPEVGERVGVIDIGSNSGRIVILERTRQGALHVLDEQRVPLRLIEAIDPAGAIDAAGRARVAAALHEFRSIADGWGVERVSAMATQALRLATNRDRILAEAAAQGVPLELLAGEQEAELAFLGAVQALPVSGGLAGDLGGGSLELTRFRDRRSASVVSLPLGAHPTTAHLAGDPPDAASVAALVAAIGTHLDPLDLALAPGEALVGSGGAIRTLAKIDRRRTGYPVERVHGYELTGEALSALLAELLALTDAERVGVPGLSARRARSILGAGLAWREVLGRSGAAAVLVSGRGLREGVAIGTAGIDQPVTATRRASIALVAGRFGSWNRARALARVRLAERMRRLTDREGSSTALRVALELAAATLDIGSAVNVYNRNRHSAALLLEAELDCVAHRDLVAAAALARQAERPAAALPEYATVLQAFAADELARQAAILAVADEVVRRSPPGRYEEISCVRDEATLVVHQPLADGAVPWDAAALAERVQGALGLALTIRGV